MFLTIVVSINITVTIDQGGDYEDDLKDCAPDGKLASGMVGPSPLSSGVPGAKV